jgi:hypothetical protein
LAGSAALAAPSPSNKAVLAATPSASKFFFSEETLPFDVLPHARGKLAINIDELGLSGSLPITGLKGEFVFNGPKIEVSDLRFGVGTKVL